MKLYLHVCYAKVLESDYREINIVVDVPSVPRVGECFCLSSVHQEELERQIEALPDKDKYYEQYTFCRNNNIDLVEVMYVLDVAYTSGGYFERFEHDYVPHIMLGNRSLLDSLKDEDQ